MSRLIDADALIEDIDGDLTDSIAEGRAIEKIMNAPTIEERKTGKWIYTRPYSAINCSSCHHCSWSMPYEDLVKSFNYCPNCGADMRGETWEH